MTKNERIEEKLSKLRELPIRPIISGVPLKRPEAMPFMMFWKKRRNEKIAMKLRLAFGPDSGATVYMDTKTMSVVTAASVFEEFSVPRLEKVVKVIDKPKARTTKRLPKAIKYARGNA